MTPTIRTVVLPVFLFTALAVAGTAQAPAQAPAVTPASFANSPLTRVGVVVRDVQKSAKVYQDIFQLDAVPTVSNVKVELPKGSAKVKRAIVTLPNVTLEVDQPDGNGPASDYLKKYGQGIYRMGFSTPDPIDAKIAALEQKGGKVTAGSRTWCCASSSS